MKNKSVLIKINLLLIIVIFLTGCSENSTREKEQQDIQKCLFLAAVVYDPAKEQYVIYHMEQALTRRSPCSTFKIISSLTALENGMIEPGNSTHTWSGEVFWNENWNQDIDFAGAFRASCVWYFREVIDEVGRELMQEELDRLQYGNCDLSDWEGRLNTNNNNRALTGFWIESSLKISPKEQTEVMERIFGENSVYSEETRRELKQVMLVEAQDKTTFPIYGKTGMGKENGIVVDAWFTGFTEDAERYQEVKLYLILLTKSALSAMINKADLCVYEFIKVWKSIWPLGK